MKKQPSTTTILIALFITIAVFSFLSCTVSRPPEPITLTVTSVKGHVVEARYSYKWFTAYFDIVPECMVKGYVMTTIISNESKTGIFRRVR